MSPKLNPVTLYCGDTQPRAAVRQQPHPLDSLNPELWITTISVGEYPNRVDIVVEHGTPEEGIAAAAALGAEIRAGALSHREQVGQ